MFVLIIVVAAGLWVCGARPVEGVDDIEAKPTIRLEQVPASVGADLPDRAAEPVGAMEVDLQETTGLFVTVSVMIAPFVALAGRARRRLDRVRAAHVGRAA